MLLFYQVVLCGGRYNAVWFVLCGGHCSRVWFVFWRLVGDLCVLSFCFCRKFARLIMALSLQSCTDF